MFLKALLGGKVLLFLVGWAGFVEVDQVEVVGHGFHPLPYYLILLIMLLVTRMPIQYNSLPLLRRLLIHLRGHSGIGANIAPGVLRLNELGFIACFDL